MSLIRGRGTSILSKFVSVTYVSTQKQHFSIDSSPPVSTLDYKTIVKPV